MTLPGQLQTLSHPLSPGALGREEAAESLWPKLGLGDFLSPRGFQLAERSLHWIPAVCLYVFSLLVTMVEDGPTVIPMHVPVCAL